MSVISKALTVNQQARGRMRNQLIRGRCHLRVSLVALNLSMNQSKHLGFKSRALATLVKKSAIALSVFFAAFKTGIATH